MIAIRSFLIILCSIGMFCCERKIYGHIMDISLPISVVKQIPEIDLLNPNAKEHYDYNKILIEYSEYSNQKVNVSTISMNKPVLGLWGNSDKYYLTILASTYGPLKDKNTIVIYWNDTDKDVLTLFVKQKENATYIDKVLVNNIVKWSEGNGQRAITISR